MALMPRLGYEACAKDEKAHGRMVMDCCWSPDGRIFATASRDKSVCFVAHHSRSRI